MILEIHVSECDPVGVRLAGTRVRDSCVPPCGYWEPRSSARARPFFVNCITLRNYLFRDSPERAWKPSLQPWQPGGSSLLRLYWRKSGCPASDSKLIPDSLPQRHREGAPSHCPRSGIYSPSMTLTYSGFLASQHDRHMLSFQGPGSLAASLAHTLPAQL